MMGKFLLSGRGAGRGEAMAEPMPERSFRILLVDGESDERKLLSLGMRMGIPGATAGWLAMLYANRTDVCVH
jgi:hypothetical protein